MKYLILGVFLFLSQAISAADSPKFEGVEYLYAKLILNGDLQVAARGIIDDEIKSPILWDMLAEKLPKAQNVQLGEFDHHRMIGAALEGSKLKRYQNVYKDSISELKPSPLLKKKKRSLAMFSEGKDVPFVKGSVDFDEISNHLETFQASNSPKNNFSYFDEAPYCKSVSEILGEFGYPEVVQVYMTHSVRQFYIGRIMLRQLLLEYKDNALVMLTRRAGKGWCLMRSLPSALSMGFDRSLDEKGRRVVKQFRLLIWQWSLHGLNSARLMMKENPEYLQFLQDEVVLRVWWGRDEKDDYTEKGIMTLFKQIKREPSSRYRKAMQSIEETAGSRKIKRAARSYLKKIPEEDVEQYIPSVEMMRLSDPV